MLQHERIYAMYAAKQAGDKTGRPRCSVVVHIAHTM